MNLEQAKSYRSELAKLVLSEPDHENRRSFMKSMREDSQFIEAEQLILGNRRACSNLIKDLPLVAAFYGQFPLDSSEEENLKSNFSSKTKEAILTAETYAVKLNVQSVTSKHLLMGSLRHSRQLRQIFQEMGRSYKAVGSLLVPTLYLGVEKKPTSDLSASAKAVIATAEHCRICLGQELITPEAIVLAMAAQNLAAERSTERSFPGSGANFIQRLDIDRRKLMARILSLREVPADYSFSKDPGKSLLEDLLFQRFGKLNVDAGSVTSIINKTADSIARKPIEAKEGGLPREELLRLRESYHQLFVSEQYAILAWLLKYNGKVPGNWSCDNKSTRYVFELGLASGLHGTLKIARDFNIQLDSQLVEAIIDHPSYLAHDLWMSQRLTASQMVRSIAGTNGRLLFGSDLEKMILAQTRIGDVNEIKVAAQADPRIQQAFNEIR